MQWRLPPKVRNHSLDKRRGTEHGSRKSFGLLFAVVERREAVPESSNLLSMAEQLGLQRSEHCVRLKRGQRGKEGA